MTSARMKIFALTGKRGGYDAMRPMLLDMQADSFFDLTVVYTDMHTLEAFGNTGGRVEGDFPNNSIKMPVPAYGSGVRSRMTALCEFQRRWALSLTFHMPDLVLLYGDRGEVIQAAVVASQCGIPIAHLQGGDTTGTVDDITRGAVSKLADLHYVSCIMSQASLVRQQEDGQRIAVVGDNHVDPIMRGFYDKPSTVRDILGVPKKGRLGIILLHPETSVDGEQEYLMSKICAAADFIENLIVIYPCSDPGHGGIVQAIKDIEGERGVLVFKNIPSPTFLGLMSIADVLIGNSSCAIIEAPYFNLAAVNIGSRQTGRMQCGNCINVPSNCGSQNLEVAIHQAIGDTNSFDGMSTYDMHYGEGNTGKRIIEDLKGVDLRRIKK